MTEKRLYESFPGGHAAYPQFESEETADACARMNDFYRALCGAARDYAASLGTAPDGGRLLYCAEYESHPRTDGVTVTYTVRLRCRGRTAAVKSFTHFWQNGWLVPPGKSSRKALDFLRRRRYNNNNTSQSPGAT